MDLATNFIFFVIFGIIGFIFSKFLGFNPYRIFTDLMSAAVIIGLIIVMFPVIINPDKAIETIPDMLNYFVSVLPGIIIGDLAGSFVSAITDF